MKLFIRAAVLVATLSALATPPATAVAAAATQPTITVAPVTGVVDGQPLRITVQTTKDVPVGGAVAHLCRDGATYAPSPVLGQSPFTTDFRLNGPNCPLNPISSSADNEANDYGHFDDPGGETFLFRAGAGVVNWKDGDTDRSLTCDSDHPCALVVELSVGSGKSQQWQPHAFTLTYAKDDPFAGCGGPAPGIVESGGSDRMVDAWVNWTRKECTLPGRTGAATRASFVGEGDAVSSFVAGTVDLAYSAGGLNADMGLVAPPDPGQTATTRKSIAIPLGLNATVVAVSGGDRVNGHNVPFRDIKLKVDETAGMISGGPLGVGPYEDAIKARNPELVGGVFDNHNGFVIGGYAGVEATTWYGTRWLKTLAPDAWKVPDNNTFFGSNGGKPRGIHNSLAVADPSFAHALDLVTGRPQLRKNVIGVAAEGAGVWALTDLVTANALSMTPVQVQNAKGDFVAPTPESLTAAVSTMKPDDAGVLIADPSATAASGAMQPYPLTMVEYAIVPAEPLVDASSCTARTDSQALLKGWLDYVVGDGQTQLPSGMVALPADIQTSAKAAIAKVGTEPVSGACAGKVATPAAVATPSGSAPTPAAPGVQPGPTLADAGAAGGLAGSGSLASGLSSTSGGGYTSPPTTAPAQVAAALAASKPEERIGIPGFGGRGVVSWLLTIGALVGFVGVTSFAGLASSGKLAVVRQRLAAKR
ncbi:MAG: hypothetical protein M3159_02650 [Actinomycetota bacterium]|nr:hypothetical protein [Actinomycetota bacterium]